MNRNFAPETTLPKVSIVSISYNQEKYIAQALESFVMQKTDFAFEVIIADDCSTDKTAKIIEEYAKRFPQLIKPILRKENVGIQRNLVDALQHAKGDYVALCEGDDFWTNPSKLQIQADFLSTHPDYSVVFHPVKVFFEKQEEEDAIFPESRDADDFTVKELLKRNFIQTNSVMYRRRGYENIPLDILPLDWYLHLYHAKYGKIGFVNEVMSTYRRHQGGVWWESRQNSDAIWTKRGLAHYSMYCEIFKLFSDDAVYKNIVQAAIYRTFGILVDIDRKYKKNIAEKAYKKYPESVDPLVVNLSKSVKDLENALYEKQEHLADLEAQLHQKEGAIAQKDEEVRQIKASKLWRALEVHRRYKRKLLGKK